jgi:carboxylesterase type B
LATQCWVDPVYDASDIQITRDIQYGSAFNNATNQTQILLLDSYFPPASDNRTERPVIVFIHGGSFDAGCKNWSGIPDFVTELARRGIVVVSIDYRLTGDFWTWESQQMMFDATEDARAAVRFVRKNAKQYGLDTERVMVMGESAGAITSLYLGYVKGAQGEGNSGNPGFSSQAQAIGAISGSLKEQAFC